MSRYPLKHRAPSDRLPFELLRRLLRHCTREAYAGGRSATWWAAALGSAKQVRDLLGQTPNTVHRKARRVAHG